MTPLRAPMLLALLTVCAACAGGAVQFHAKAANAVALAANEALPALVATYRGEGLDAIARAPDRPAAEAALAALRARWRPVWGTCDGEPPSCRDGAWPALRAAHAAWAEALEQAIAGRPLDLAAARAHAARLRATYCAVRAAAPTARLPDVPALPCGGPPP